MPRTKKKSESKACFFPFPLNYHTILKLQGIIIFNLKIDFICHQRRYMENERKEKKVTQSQLLTTRAISSLTM